jgi:hypothetical protein
MWNFIIIIFRSTTADPTQQAVVTLTSSSAAEGWQGLCVRGFEPVLAAYHILRLIPGHQ